MCEIRTAIYPTSMRDLCPNRSEVIKSITLSDDEGVPRVVSYKLCQRCADFPIRGEIEKYIKPLVPLTVRTLDTISRHPVVSVVLASAVPTGLLELIRHLFS